MLVLSRKVGQEIVIGSGNENEGGSGQIVVRVNDIGGGRVSLGIDAPRDISIKRGELRPLVADKTNKKESVDDGE